MFLKPDRLLNQKSYRFMVQWLDQRLNLNQTNDVINIIYILYKFKYIIKNINNILFFIFDISNYIIGININIFNFIK